MIHVEERAVPERREIAVQERREGGKGKLVNNVYNLVHII
jgi:hypothetical protein